ncbi:AAA family ATPase [Candidatus Bathyarchaeota archaeon]|nr:AAA family ATPase [Candidatus Bathyarchaeota archaeon]
MLGGGLPRGHLTLIYGEAGSGKTTLALQAAVKAMAKGFKTIYIDSDERLSSRRLLQIAGSLGEETLQRMLILRPNSFSEQTYIVESLERYISRGVALIVLDSITRLYRAELSETRDSFGLNRELNRQMAYLSKTAKTFDLSILTISQVRAFDKRGLEPVAGRVLRFWSSIVIRMELTGKPDVRQVTVEKNSLTGKKGVFMVKITAEGLEDV